MTEDSDPRARICRSLGIADVAKAHETILAGRAKGAEWLLARGLNAPALTQLGYTAAGMTKLGYAAAALRQLGYDVQAPEEQPPPEAVLGERIGSAASPAELIAKGYRANELRQAGLTIRHCRMADVPARDLYRLGFTVDEMVGEFSAAELRSLGLNPRDLNRFFSGPQLRKAGFSASEMRLVGYSVRELLDAGYNENHIVTAGYATRDLVKEGLTKLVRDKGKLSRA